MTPFNSTHTTIQKWCKIKGTVYTQPPNTLYTTLVWKLVYYTVIKDTRWSQDENVQLLYVLCKECKLMTVQCVGARANAYTELDVAQMRVSEVHSRETTMLTCWRGCFSRAAAWSWVNPATSTPFTWQHKGKVIGDTQKQIRNQCLWRGMIPCHFCHAFQRLKIVPDTCMNVTCHGVTRSWAMQIDIHT